MLELMLEEADRPIAELFLLERREFFLYGVNLSSTSSPLSHWSNIPFLVYFHFYGTPRSWFLWTFFKQSRFIFQAMICLQRYQIYFLYFSFKSSISERWCCSSGYEPKGSYWRTWMPFVKNSFLHIPFLQNSNFITQHQLKKWIFSTFIGLY